MDTTSAKVVLLLSAIACVFGGCLGAPGRPSDKAEALSFMRKYGYVGSGDGVGQAQALLIDFSEQTFAEAIKQVQKFGGLEQTGRLDELTQQLMGSKRCGVADLSKEPVELPPNHHHSRMKRYILGSRGWNKRRLTYYLANWPENLRKEEVTGVIKSALDTWAKHGRLKFRPTSDHSKADIVFGFYRGHHGDPFPFDKEGKVLAHAFFPGQSSSHEGDVHYDADELWAVNHKPGGRSVDLFSVTLHELGHSLGLSHSPEKGSVMNAYYRSDYKDLGYDDMLAMHKLYVERHLDDDGFGDEEDEEEESIPQQDPPHRHPPHRHPPTSSTTMRYDGATTKRKNWQGTWYEPKPLDGCQGSFDTVAYIRGELFVIKNKMLWRLRGPGQVLPNYPVDFRRMFKLPEHVKTIDAMYERETDSSIVIFAGSQYWVYNGNEFVDSPRPLTDYGLPWSMTKVDGVTVRNGTTYIFSGIDVWMYDEKTKTLSKDSPKPIQKTFSFPTTVDSVMTYNDGNMYLFKGNQYWVFTDRLTIPRNVPSTASGHWLGC